MGTWDKGADFTYLLNYFRQMLKSRRTKEKCYAQIFLIQLKNGTRISEAVNAWLAFMKTGSRELEVKIAKRKDGATRKVFIPSEVKREDVCYKMAMLEPSLLKKRAITYLRDKSGGKLNTHTLRYALATYLLREGLSAPLVSDILGHKSPQPLMRYIQKKTVNEILKSVNEEL